MRWVGKMIHNNKPVIMFGAGQRAEILHCLLHQVGYEIAAFCLDAAWRKTDRFKERPVVDFEGIDQIYAPHEYQLIVAVGYQHLNQLRADRVAAAQAMGYELLSYISPEASLWPGFVPGVHCRIGTRSLIQPFAEVGDNVSIGSGCIIGHHSKIQDHAFIASGVMLGGGGCGDRALRFCGYGCRDSQQCPYWPEQRDWKWCGDS
ncbi:MAG: transferase [Candidatus Sericytochromatia bacterium]|nr:transferase [Candidatus Sericytochromatia bacterium]